MRAVANPQIVSGLAVTINAVESHKIDISDGVLKFADIEANIRGNVTGHETFKQQLVALEARRLWKASGLWYDDTESELIAKLDGSNNVQYCDPTTGLQSLTDGEYTAVWVVATFCNHRPVKIVLGSYKALTAEEAKTLNTPDSFVDLSFGDCAEVNHVISRVIIKDIAVAPWYEITEIDDTIRDDDAFNPSEKGDPGDDGREVELSTDSGYVVWRYVGETVWNNLVSLASITGPSGREIELGVVSGYIVWRYQGETTWTNLIALSAITGSNGREIELRENAGWVEWRYTGDVTWVQLYEIPTGGGGGDTFLVHLKFEAVGSIVYTAPYDCKFTAMKYSQTNAPTLSVALDTNIAEYGDLTVTADATGLVTLTGTWL